MKEPACPECDKMLAVKERSQAIGEFIDWLREQGIQMTQAHEHTDSCYTVGFNKTEFRAYHKGSVRKGLFSDRETPVCTSEELKAGRFDSPKCGIAEGTLFPVVFRIEDKLAEFFEIDLQKAEKEKRQLLDFVRWKSEQAAKRTELATV